MVKIYVNGRECEVPSGLTIVQAMEHIGYKFIRGSGCRGGFCGACATISRVKETHELTMTLACQRIVEDGMYLNVVLDTPAKKAIYDSSKLRPSESVLLDHYPEIVRCLSCNTCTKACPQDLPVMDFVQAALRGDIEDVAKISFECVECGLCALRCPVGIVPHYVARLARRLYAKYFSRPSEPLAKRVKEIEEGVFDEELERYVKMDIEELKKLYAKLHAE